MKKAMFISERGGQTLRMIYPEYIRKHLEETLEFVPEVTEVAAMDKAQVRDVNYLFSTWGMPAFTEAEIQEYFPKLEGVFYGAGSVQAFARPFLNLGIPVYSSAAANAVPVAEYTVSQIILAQKGFYQAARMYKEGRRDAARAYSEGQPGNYDTTIGLIGAGLIGKLVIRMLKQYRMEVVVFDPFLPDEMAAELGVRKCSLEELFEISQVVSNHLANNEATKGMLNYALFSRMKQNATFINTGRGAQVVEADLVRAMKECPERTAVLDVTMPEPVEAGHPFYELENVILTPHIAGSMQQETARMGAYQMEAYDKVRSGECSELEVTLEMLETMA